MNFKIVQFTQTYPTISDLVQAVRDVRREPPSADVSYDDLMFFVSDEYSNAVEFVESLIMKRRASVYDEAYKFIYGLIAESLEEWYGEEFQRYCAAKGERELVTAGLFPSRVGTGDATRWVPPSPSRRVGF